MRRRGSVRTLADLVQSRRSSRLSEQTRVPVRRGNAEKKSDRGLVFCISDCETGPIELHPETAVVRLSVGHVRYKEERNRIPKKLLAKIGEEAETFNRAVFDNCLRFPSGKKHCFAHNDCARQAGLRVEELSMDYCLVPSCGQQFFSDRGREEGCLHIELGYFEEKKGLPIFQSTKAVAVHWACAAWFYQWELFEKVVDSARDPGFKRADRT